MDPFPYKKSSSKLHIDLPKDVAYILGKLKDHGFEAFIVGGSVRDALLGKKPVDWDVTTNAHPEEIKRIFKKTVDTGIAHGTVSVLLKGRPYEITTYRKDGRYLDHRHPEKVSFKASLKDDLKRRDFTINAMAYSPDMGLLDLFGGVSDLSSSIIRAVGIPDERFTEDALRMLRAARFAAQLDFDIEEKTKKSIKDHAGDLSFISKERIYTELSKLICSPHIEKLREVFDLGLAPYIATHFDEIDFGIVKDLMKADGCGVDIFDKEDTGKVATFLKGREYGKYLSDPILDDTDLSKLIGFSTDDAKDFSLKKSIPLKKSYIRFAYISKGMEPLHVREMLQSLKADNDTIKKAQTLVCLIKTPFPATGYELKKLMSKYDPLLFKEALVMKIKSARASSYDKFCEKEKLDLVFFNYKDIIDKKEPVYLKDLSISGDDIIHAGKSEGPGIGEILNELLDKVQRDPGMNDKKLLLEFL